MKIGRSSVTGRFTTVKTARRLDSTHEVEQIKRKKPRSSKK
jgi:hypothetical protein